MIIALKVIGYVLLAIIVLLLLVIIMPLTFNVEYFQKQLTVRFRLIFPFVIYPRKKKKKEKASDKKPKKDHIHKEHAKKDGKAEAANTGGTQKEPDKNDSSDLGIMDIAKALLPQIPDTLKKLLKNIKIRNTVIIIPVYHPDPMSNGILIGDVWAAIGNLMPFVKMVFNIEFNRIDVIPDFENHYQNDIMLAADIRSSVLLLLISVAALVKEYLKLTKKERRK